MKNKFSRALCEGAVMIALAQILGYLKLYEMPNGGSVTPAMIPLFFFAVRWGLKKSLLVCFAYGLLQFLLDGAYALSWQAIILDYVVAYGLLGFAGIFKGKKAGVFCGTLLGIFLRFAGHTLSGVYVWAEYMPEEFLGLAMVSPWIYSLLYNGVYMSLNLILCLAVFSVLQKPLQKYIMAQDILY